MRWTCRQCSARRGLAGPRVGLAHGGGGPVDSAAAGEGLLGLGVAELLREGGARDLAEPLRAEPRLRVWFGRWEMSKSALE